jgi:hypothetical protein
LPNRDQSARLNGLVSSAAFRVKERDQILKGVRVGRVPQKAALAPDADQVLVPELVEVVRKRGGRNAQFALNLANNKSLRMGREQKLHNSQTGFRTHGGKKVCVPAGLFGFGRACHDFDDSRIIESCQGATFPFVTSTSSEIV